MQDVFSARHEAGMTFEDLMQLDDTEEGHLLLQAAYSRHSVLSMSDITSQQE